MGGKTALTLSIVTLLTAVSARAQAEASEPAEASEAGEASETADASQTQQVSEAPAPAADGGRFRFGINGTVGLESASNAAASISGAMFGVDARFGWQFSDLLAIYAQPHLSFGSIGPGGGVSEVTGTFVATVMGEATFLDRFFGAAGLGYGMFNDPSGLALDFRAGGYPLMGREGARRTGLMLGVDFRTVFLPEGITGIMFMGCIGYESF